MIDKIMIDNRIKRIEEKYKIIKRYLQNSTINFFFVTFSFIYT